MTFSLLFIYLLYTIISINIIPIIIISVNIISINIISITTPLSSSRHHHLYYYHLYNYHPHHHHHHHLHHPSLHHYHPYYYRLLIIITIININFAIMLAVIATSSPTSGISENWRVRRGSNEREGTKRVRETSVSRKLKEMTESWRARKEEVSNAVEVSAVYGDCSPPECRLQDMFHQLKADNNRITTWLVESVYPSIENLPPYITLSTKQTPHHDKYDIGPSKLTQLANQPRKVPASMVALIDQLIAERTEYSYWMSRKCSDAISTESHDYYITMFKQVKSILAKRMEPEEHQASHTEPPKPAKATSTPDQTLNSTSCKRKSSFTPLQSHSSRKAAKTDSSTSKDTHTVENHANHPVSVQHTQQDKPIQAIAEVWPKTTKNACAIVAKPISYAAALRVAPVA